MLKLENSIRGLSFSRVAFDLTIQATKRALSRRAPYIYTIICSLREDFQNSVIYFLLLIRICS